MFKSNCTPLNSDLNEVVGERGIHGGGLRVVSKGVDVGRNGANVAPDDRSSEGVGDTESLDVAHGARQQGEERLDRRIAFDADAFPQLCAESHEPHRAIGNEHGRGVVPRAVIVLNPQGEASELCREF